MLTYTIPITCNRAATSIRALFASLRNSAAGWATPQQLPGEIDVLFKGCVAEWKRTRPAETDPAIENEMVTAISQLLHGEGMTVARSQTVAREIEMLSWEFVTMGNRRKNALGEGFEDLLYLLLLRVSKIADDRIALRKPVSELPGVRRAPPRRAGARSDRQPHPDIAIVEGGTTHVITTAKWSMQQDRQTQFHASAPDSGGPSGARFLHSPLG